MRTTEAPSLRDSELAKSTFPRLLCRGISKLDDGGQIRMGVGFYVRLTMFYEEGVWVSTSRWFGAGNIT